MKANLKAGILLIVFMFFTITNMVFAGQWVKTETGVLVWNEFPEASEIVNWSGESLNGIAHGFGVLEWFIKGKLSQKYIGVLKAGKKKGRGWYQWADRSIYCGHFLNNMRHGRGIYKNSAESLYNGFWIDNKKVSNDDYQKHLDSINSNISIGDLKVGNFFLEDFFDQSVIGTSKVESYSTEYGDFKQIHFKEYDIIIRQLDFLNKWIIDDITILSREIETPRGVKVGDTVEKIISAYGQPDFRNNRYIGYNFRDTGIFAAGSYISVLFTINKDIVSKISIGIGFECDD